MFTTDIRKRLTRVLFRIAPVLLLTAALPACALLTGDDPEEEDEDDVTGVWEREDGYIRITSSTVTFYEEGPGGCYFITVFDVVDVDGTTYELDYEGLTFEVEFTRDGDELEMEIEGDVIDFEESSLDASDLNDLDECEPLVFEPELGTCSSHTQLPVPGSVGGALASGDLSTGGFLYDRYRVNLTTTTNLTVTQTSSQIDSYMFLFAADGSYITEDDDGAGNFNSQIDVSSLPAGCYIVLASSFDPGEVGSYNLTASTF